MRATNSDGGSNESAPPSTGTREVEMALNAIRGAVDRLSVDDRRAVIAKLVGLMAGPAFTRSADRFSDEPGQWNPTGREGRLVATVTLDGHPYAVRETAPDEPPPSAGNKSRAVIDHARRVIWFGPGWMSRRNVAEIVAFAADEVWRGRIATEEYRREEAREDARLRRRRRGGRR